MQGAVARCEGVLLDVIYHLYNILELEGGELENDRGLPISAVV